MHKWFPGRRTSEPHVFARTPSSERPSSSCCRKMIPDWHDWLRYRLLHRQDGSQSQAEHLDIRVRRFQLVSNRTLAGAVQNIQQGPCVDATREHAVPNTE